MKDCEQTQGMSVLAHGEMVYAYYLDLRNHVTQGAPLQYEWKMPDWFADKNLWRLRKDEAVIEEYMGNHDCSKPLVRTVDENGKVHFPDHAKVSEAAWLHVDGSEEAAKLMGMDMDIHLLKAEGQEAFAKRPEAATLLIAGLCEIHANASMFGGIDSTSFKIKWKHIDKRGKQIVKLLGY